MNLLQRAIVLVALPLLILPAAAAVDDDEYNARRGIRDRGNVSVGGFLVGFDTLARLDSDQLGPGTPVDFENDLDFDSSSTDFRLDGYWRMARKHRLEYAFMLFDRGATATLDDEIQYGDETFDVDATVGATFRTQVFKLAYKYSIVNNGWVEAGISVGFSVLDFEASIAASGNVGGMGGALQRAEESLIAPVPVIGVHVNATLHPKWFVRASWEYFGASAQEIEATLSDAKVTFDYYPWKHVGFGLGYNAVNVDFLDGDLPSVEVNYKYDGALGYVSFIF